MALTRGLLDGTPNGTETDFTIPESLVSGSEQIFRQGVSQFIIASGTPVKGQVKVVGAAVTFPAAPDAPKTGDTLSYYGEQA